jgi:uncharacterized protein YkwD
MTNMLRRAAALAAMSTALVGGAILGTTPASAATAPSSDATFEARVVKLTNDNRVKNGCAAVRTETRLTTAARAHSVDMASKNYFNHTAKDGSTFLVRAKRAGYTTAVGENIAWGYRTPEQVVTAWMNSSGHRANILSGTFKDFGAGFATRGRAAYYTLDFGYRRG